jgi:predicted nucleotidyltransferase
MIAPGIEVEDARLAAICDKYGIGELRIFSSGARGTPRPDSDILIPCGPGTGSAGKSTSSLMN